MRNMTQMKKIGAITMAAALILGQLPMNALAASAGAGNEGDQSESVIIREFSSLPEEVATQRLPVGAKESDISFPAELKAVAVVPEENKEESSETDKDKDKESGSATDSSSSGTSGEEKTEPGTGEATEGGSQENTDKESSGTEGQGSTDGESEASSETGGQQEGNPSENQEKHEDSHTEAYSEGNPGDAPQNIEPAGSEEGKSQENTSEQEPAAEEKGSDSASAERIYDIFDALTIPMTVYAAEGEVILGTDQEQQDPAAEKTEEITLQGITWKLNANASSKETFSSETAGDSFEYLPELPSGYTTEATLPSITVIIEKQAEEISFIKNEFGPVKYVDADDAEATVEEYLSIGDAESGVTLSDGWYVVGKDATLSADVTVKGNVKLVLLDEKTLKVSNIAAETGSSLTIFGQGNSTGKLLAEYTSEDGKTAIDLNGGDFIQFGASVIAKSSKGCGLKAGNAIITDGSFKAEGETGIYTDKQLSVLGGMVSLSSIGSESLKSGNVVLGYTGDGDFIEIAGAINLMDGKAVNIVENQLLTDGTDLFYGEYTGTSVPSYSALASKTLIKALQESTPEATFVASSTQSGKLKKLVAGQEYIISGAGLTETVIKAAADGTFAISKGLKVGDLLLVKKGVDGSFNSEAQTFTLTKAANPSKISASGCTTSDNNDGKISGLDSAKKYEYRNINDSKYSSVPNGATSITGLKDGTYYVRLRPVGTMLASASRKVVISAYTAPKKVATPTFSPKAGSYTSAQKVTIRTTTTGATIYYTLDGTVPSTDSDMYTGPITVDKNMMIKAIAVKEGMTNSSVASGVYYVTIKKTTTGTTTKSTSTVKSSTTKKTGTTTTAKTAAKTTTGTTKTTGSTTKSSTAKSSASTSKSSASKSKSSASSSSSVSKSSKSRTSGQRPYIEGNPDQEGWDVIRDKLGSAGNKHRVRVNMNGDSEVPSATFEEIRGKDVTLVLNIGDGLTWSVNGLDVKGNEIDDVDLGVVMDTDSIPEEVIGEVVSADSEHPSRQLSLDYDGEFGFTAVLSVDIDTASAGLYANLFYFNPATEKLEFVSSGKIGPDGFADLIFSHASDYTIVVNETPMGENTITTHVSPETEIVASETVEEPVQSVEPSEVLMAEASTDTDVVSEEEYKEAVEEFEAVSESSFNAAPIIGILLIVLICAAIVFLWLQNKKKPVLSN